MGKRMLSWFKAIQWLITLLSLLPDPCLSVCLPVSKDPSAMFEVKPTKISILARNFRISRRIRTAPTETHFVCDSSARLLNGVVRLENWTVISSNPSVGFSESKQLHCQKYSLIERMMASDQFATAGTCLTGIIQPHRLCFYRFILSSQIMSHWDSSPS